MDQPNLISLTLENTGVRGSGFQRADIPSVQTVFLTGSPVTDRGLSAMNKQQFPELQQIVVVDTEVSSGAVKAYLEHNPIILRRDR